MFLLRSSDLLLTPPWFIYSACVVFFKFLCLFQITTYISIHHSIYPQDEVEVTDRSCVGLFTTLRKKLLNLFRNIFQGAPLRRPPCGVKFILA